MRDLYRWIDRRGRIPWWVRLLWRRAHWCPEMDYLLILDNPLDCFCNRCDKENAKYRGEFYEAVKKQQDKFDRDNDTMLF